MVPIKHTSPQPGKSFISFLMFCLSPQKTLFFLAFCAVVVFNLLELVFPKLLQLFIDAIEGNPLIFLGLNIESFSMGTIPIIYIIPFALVFFALFRWVFYYFRTVIQTRLGQGVLYDLRKRIYDTMQSLSFTYHDNAHTGTLISNVVEDVGYASRFFEFGLYPLIEAPTYIIIVYVVMFLICWPAACISLMVFSVSFLSIFLFFKYGHNVFARTKKLFAETVQLFTENIEGHLVIRAYGEHRRQQKYYNESVNNLHNATFKEVFVFSAMSQTMVYAAVFGIFMVLGAALFIRQRYGWTITDGNLFMLYFLQASIIQRVRMVNRSLDLVMRMNITAERLNPLFTNQNYLPETTIYTIPQTGPRSIEMKHCYFSYRKNYSTLNDISLTISAGQTIGFVGVTGSGKSTLALLLCRFYDPIKGKILLDGKNIAHYAIQDVRNQFALIFQETFLFSASIRDNIAYGKPHANDEEVVQAAKAAQIHDFIKDLPEGYATLIGERGVTLSGGQQQRISIARAILRKPKCIILDDCTSALDSKTEYALQHALDALDESITKIIIAHRTSSVINADMIYVLDEGTIVESGTHFELNVPGTAFRRILQPDSEESRR